MLKSQSKRKIFELPLGYRILRRYVYYTFREYFDEITITGKENLPENAPIIFAPNHLNALMDPLAMSLIFQYDKSTIYLARADVFKKKTTAKFLNYVKILPAFRIRDGFENLGKNAEIFETCKEVLKQKHNLCIMPEGNQEIERNVRPLVKGLFRVAFSAQEETDAEIFIVPIGLDYDDLINFGENLIINIGKPISVKSYKQAYAENPAKTTTELRNKLRNSLIELTVHIDTKINYACFETLFNVATESISAMNNLEKNPVKKFELRKKIAGKLVQYEKEDEKITEHLKELCERYNQISKNLNIKFADIKKIFSVRKNEFFILLRLALLFPVFSLGFILNALAFYTPLLVRKIARVEYTGYFSSVNYATSIISFPLFYILQSAIITFAAGLNFWWFLFIIPLQFFLGKIAFYGWYKPFRNVLSSFKIRNLKKKSTENYSNLKSIIDEIVKLLYPEIIF